MRLVWLLDDTPHWHAITAATVTRCPGWEFAGFFHSRTLFAALEDHHDEPEALPAVILMDFFLRGERGDTVTAALRRRSLSDHLSIIAHSTTTLGNEAILRAGADTCIRKAGGPDGINHDLWHWLLSETEPPTPPLAPS